MKAVFKIKESPTRIPETNKGDSKMKANTFFYTRLILGLALAIALLAANSQRFALANASAISVDNIATTRHLTMVYETPSVESRVAIVLMPVTEVSLAGRSADGKWLALGNGWIQRSDIHTDSNLAALPVARAAQTFIATTRHLTMVYETPSVESRVAIVLMPVTEVSLAGRSADGKWLALGNGWIKKGDVHTDGNLAFLPILDVVAAMDLIAGH
jgi:hypothetical protein